MHSPRFAHMAYRPPETLGTPGDLAYFCFFPVRFFSPRSFPGLFSPASRARDKTCELSQMCPDGCHAVDPDVLRSPCEPDFTRRQEFGINLRWRVRILLAHSSRCLQAKYGPFLARGTQAEFHKMHLLISVKFSLDCRQHARTPSCTQLEKKASFEIPCLGYTNQKNLRIRTYE